MMTTAEKAKAVHPIAIWQEHLQSHASDLKAALPSTIPVEKFVDAATTAARLNPDLIACNRQSLWNACLRAASDGLLPDGREGAIVPFKDQAQWMPMVGGVLKRFRNSGQFLALDCDIVRENEEFTFWKDEKGPHFHHVPGDGTGKPIKAYAIAHTKDGGVMIDVMTEPQINKRRNASRAKNSPLWNEWMEEAWIKTVLRHLAKRLPMSSDLDDLVRRDDDLYDFKPTAAETAMPTAAPITNVVEALGRFGSTDDSLTEGAEYDEAPEAPELSAAEYEAYEKGREAKRNGHLRKAVPGEYRSVEMSHLAKLWWQGWDDEAENRPWSREQGKP